MSFFDAVTKQQFLNFFFYEKFVPRTSNLKPISYVLSLFSIFNVFLSHPVTLCVLPTSLLISLPQSRQQKKKKKFNLWNFSEDINNGGNLSQQQQLSKLQVNETVTSTSPADIKRFNLFQTATQRDILLFQLLLHLHKILNPSRQNGSAFLEI